MRYLTVRLLRNGPRGRIGDVVDVPERSASAMLAADEAEVVIDESVTDDCPASGVPAGGLAGENVAATAAVPTVPGLGDRGRHAA